MTRTWKDSFVAVGSLETPAVIIRRPHARRAMGKVVLYPAEPAIHLRGAPGVVATKATVFARKSEARYNRARMESKWAALLEEIA